jgi:hypothetical protein
MHPIKSPGRPELSARGRAPFLFTTASPFKSKIFPASPQWLVGMTVSFLLAVSPAGAWQMKQAPLMTQWAALVDTNLPLPEYPRPQLVRTNWLNLNGLWQFQVGATNQPAPTGQTLSGQILVPYPMESALSGVMQYSEFSWYRRTFTVPAGWSGQRIILHFGAVTWQAQVYVNGQSAGLHRGGYDPISYDITPYLISGTNELIVRVYSPEDNGGQPRGKQTLYPGGIMYTSSSGLWQTVWLEPVSATGVSSLQIIPDVDNARLRLTVNTYSAGGTTVAATVLAGSTVISGVTGSPQTELDLPVPNANLWSPENPWLYNLQIAVISGGVTNDSVTSYFGMRKIATNIVNGEPEIYLNNKPYFGMGPLDQGFWPDGIYTAPTDAALEFDLQEEKALGFNSVRKHEKVEPARWYYWADKLGLLVWQDMPTGNSYTGNANPPAVDPLQFISELSALVTNHWNSPCIIMWDVFNEDQGEAGSGDGVGQTNTAYLVQLVKTLDPSRLVNEASGGSYFGVGDVFDNHNYPPPGNPTSSTQAPVDGEYGGIGYLVPGHLWNAGQASTADIAATSETDIALIYDSYSDDLITDKAGGLNAAIETQTTDVENECDGLLTYDRFIKTDPTRLLLSNQKAITGQATVTTVAPTSQIVPQTWQWTTNTPATNWYATNFNASVWKTGTAGFGTVDPNVNPRTPWTTPGYIYLRRSFNPGPLTTRQLSQLGFTVYHDEDVVIYINGVLAASASGYSTAYVNLAMTPQAQAALIPSGTNVMAVSCYQSTGGQFIDVGLSDELLVANTLTVPTDAAGYWPLDATNGTVAADASGSGDNGTVTNGAWNAHGKINGCLSFNGRNASVQISNLVSNDFSLAFWVKTTRTGGSGPWYKGDGLVDGFVAANANDFGAALCGGQFAFGVGNPDTTIFSTNVINDGGWHHCVATRVKSAGALSLYVDGVLQATGTGTTNSLNAASILRFGAIAAGGGWCQGSLDEVMIYNRALGNNEVTALDANTAGPLAAPTNFVATAGSGQVALSWNESLFAASYTASRATTSGGPYTALGTTTGTTWSDTNAVDGTTYYYVVSAANTFGAGTNSAEVTACPFTLAAWFKATALTGLANGGLVATWPDASGNTNNATQSTASQQPAYVTKAMNGLPVVRFNAATSNFLAFNRTVQDDFTFIIVYQSSQNNQGSGTAFYQGAGLVNGDQPDAQYDFGTQINAVGQVVAGTGNPDTSINSGTGFNNGQPHVVTFERTESSGALALFVDGTEVATGTGTTLPLMAPPQLYLGAVPSGGGFFSGDLAEVLVFDVVLTNSTRIAYENALRGEYGLSPGIAPAAPTGLTGTAGNRQIALTWHPAIGAGSYTLWRSTNNGATFQMIASALTATSYGDATAWNGQTNYYEIAAANSLATSTNSAAIGVFLPEPRLSGTSAGANAISIVWPAWASDWQLYYATNLVPPVIWFPATNAVGSNNGQFTVTLPASDGPRFFRLGAP